MTINSPSGPSGRVFLNPTIVMEKICYLREEWESGRVGEWESGALSLSKGGRVGEWEI